MKTIELLNQIRGSLSENQKEDFDISVNTLIDYAKNDIISTVSSITRNSKFKKRNIDIVPHIRKINNITKKTRYEVIFEENDIDIAHKQVIGIIRQVVDR